MEKLRPDASGLRHLRWAREILGALEAHLEHGELDERGRVAVAVAAAELGRAIDLLSAAVKLYRDFLERRRSKFRGAVRAGRHWGRDLELRLAELDAHERAPLKAGVRAAVAELHLGLFAVDARLGELGPELIDSIYPPLAGGDRVRDDGDRDDDATG